MLMLRRSIWTSYLCVMFLMDEAKNVNKMFGVPQSSHHTISDATSDIVKIAAHLRSEGASKEDKHRKGDQLVDPMVAGSRKVA